MHPQAANREAPGAVEWPTLALIAACYAAWGLATTWLAGAVPVLGFAVTALAVTLHSSLSHEALHGHPFRSRRLNEALVFPALGLFIPYRRFRDTHIAHHRDEALTDPYDDPETNFLDPAVWARLPVPVRWLLRANNTLLGRVVLGPALGIGLFLAGDWRLLRAGAPGIAWAWALHGLGLVPVLAWVIWLSPMPLWAYLTAVYLGHGILKIRTYLEHRAHEAAPARTVIIEDRGPLAFLFLNNNLHAVHHARPGVAWYRLPALYRAEAEQWLARNGGYRYGSYGEVFRRHLLRAKDPVAHPLGWSARSGRGEG